eukprot:s686_g10.t1
MARIRIDTAEALARHQSVSPDRWCITHADLNYLRQEVWRAIQCGSIRPPEDGTDDFLDGHEQCGQIGPSIYTVNAQHIMPVTEQAGKISWALMRHPDGLDCHLFISHAWQEGVFEFLSKVLHSWPRQAHHAWCCMLANPQNLDIAALLQSPRSSPFAQAIRASIFVLVVPNRRSSIYTRLWCAYEAYEAHELGKFILVASAPDDGRLYSAVACTTLAGLAGMFVGIALKSWLHHGLVAIAFFCVMVSVCQLTSPRPVLPRCLESDLPGIAAYEPRLRQHLFFLAAAIFFGVMEVDRIRGESRMQEALHLRRGFQGSIAQATCSQAEDAEKIRIAIGSRTDAVDHAIHVLLTAGMSTPTLREMDRAGISIEGAGGAEVALPFLFLAVFHFLSLLQLVLDITFLRCVWQYWLWPGIPVAIRSVVILMIWWSPSDERCFAFKMIAKVVSGYILISCPLLVYWEWNHDDVTEEAAYTWFILPAIAHVIVFTFTCLGMRGTRAIPCCGRCLLNSFLARGRNVLPN